MIAKGRTIIALSGALAVALGAFGAHGLKSVLEPTSLQSYQTGVLYHFIHTLAMGLCYVLWLRDQNNSFRQAFVLFLVGMILFSGSLYAMALGKAAGADLTFLGPVTPIGGLAFIGGWLRLIGNK